MDLFRMFGVPQGMGGGFGGGFGMPGAAAMPQGPFRETYRCYPVVMMANKQSLEAGDKIILPTSALDTLARLRVTYPMSFSLVNPKNRESKTHCGVMEFSAEEGTCYIPYWMMQNLLIESGGLIEVTNVSLRKGNFVKFQPHSNKFTQLHNPRVVLERALRNFSCLTKGGTIVIQHGSENFYLDVKELRPDNAVSIIETDMNVDFEPAKDAPAETRPAAGASASSSSAAAGKDDVSFFVPTSTNPVAPAGVTAAQRDFSSGGWGSGGADEASTTDSTASSSVGLTKSTSNDYFSKLGSGNKLREAGKRKVSTSATSGVSSASPSPSPSPSLGPSGSLSASNSLNSLSSLRAAGSATPVGGASASTPQSRPTSALASRAGGYSLSGSSSSSKPPAGPTASSTASRPSTASSTPSLSSSSSQSSLAMNAAKTVVERQGNWDYYYELLPNNQKKLVRRLPAKDKPAAAPAASSSSSSSPAPVSGLAAMGPGHRLK